MKRILGAHKVLSSLTFLQRNAALGDGLESTQVYQKHLFSSGKPNKWDKNINSNPLLQGSPGLASWEGTHQDGARTKPCWHLLVKIHQPCPAPTLPASADAKSGLSHLPHSWTRSSHLHLGGLIFTPRGHSPSSSPHSSQFHPVPERS